MPPPLPADLDLDPDTEVRLQRLATARRRSPRRIVQEAVAQYVAREEARERLNQDTLAAWDDFQATGLHATGAEVDAWLDKLEAGEAVPPPECHE